MVMDMRCKTMAIMAMDVRCKIMALSTITSMSCDSNFDGMVACMKCSFPMKKSFKLHCLGGSCDHHLLPQESGEFFH